MQRTFSKVTFLIVALAAAMFSCGSASVAFAEPQAIELPAGVGPLPLLSSSTSTGAIVASDSVRSYRTILPEPLFDLVQSGEWSFEAAKLPPAAQDYGAASAAAASVRVASSGELSPIPGKITGPLFLADAGVLGDGENFSTRAYKVLWNVATLLWSSPYSNSELSLSVFRESIAGGRRVHWSVQRVYPGHFDTHPGTLAPLFREKISGVLPTVLDGLHWLTIRSLGEVDDYVWVASPITGHVRRMSATNRSDQIFAGAFSPDDLFVWSGKVERVKPTAMTRQTLLVPFARRALIEVAAEAKDSSAGRCQKHTAEASAVVELNESSRRFRDVAAYVPTNVVMSPRRVVRVDFASHDPFSRDVTTSLFVDEETNVPVYKIVFGRDGRMSQFVVGVVGRVVTGQKAQPLPVAQVILHAPKKDRAVIVMDAVTVCRDFPANISFATFDPGQLVPKQEGAKVNVRPAEKSNQTASESPPPDSDD